MGQLIKADEVVGLALVIGAVLGILHGAKVDLGPAGEVPHMGRGVVLRLWKGPAVVHLAFVHQIRQLRVCFAQDQRSVMRNIHLTQCLDDQCIAFSAAGGVGTVPGVLVGVLVFELMKVALQFMNVNSSYTYIVQGLVIIVAVAIDIRKYLAKK